MAENEEPPEPQGPPDPLSITPLTRRGAPAPERPPLPRDIEEQFNHLKESIEVLSAHFLGEPEPVGESLRERTARRIKKFHRAAGDERAASTGEDPSGESAEGAALPDDDGEESLALNKTIAWPRKTDLQERAGADPVTAPWWPRQPPPGAVPVAVAIMVLLLLVGYLAGHAASSARTGNGGYRPGRPTVDLFDEPEAAAQAAQTADEGLKAEHSGEGDKARKIYEAALAKHVALAGMNYRLAVLAVQRNDRLDAEQRLERSTLDDENVADCCYVLARLAADRGDYDGASNQFQRATRAQPFIGKYFFYWGELLRRQGKPQAAVAAFEQALVRPYVAEDGDLYLFKQRLAKIEFGHDDAFNADLAERLKATPVAADWLLLAAAQEMDRQNYPVAAEHLRLASDRMPALIFAELTRDYFFAAHAKHPEVASLLHRTPNVDISSAGPSVLDPGAWSPERGDPGTWASASP